VPDAVLLDAHCPGQYGGTGQAFDWGSVVQSREVLPDLPLVLAGGLTPFNIIEAIDAARPDAVDVASGVESAPARKDILLIRAFCTNAKKSLARLSDEA
jgi:phosphoribosylanthranilate isomerase